MYSEKLQAIKSQYLSAQFPSRTGATLDFGVGREQLKEMILGFCKADDVIGIKHEIVFDLFDEYCKENGYPIVNRQTLGRTFCAVFGLCRKKAKRDGQLCWVYVKKPTEN